MLIDAVVSFSHYESHVRPIWDLLPGDVRGSMWASRHGLDLPTSPARWPKDRLVLCAGWVDVHRSRPRQCILVEHGAGQSYSGDRRSAGHPSYSGGRGHENVRLFVCPSETVAARWRSVYPDTPTAVVGSPRLDRFHYVADDGINESTAVAMAWHWDNPLCPESRSAWPHYRDAVEPLLAFCASEGRELLGHAHPRVLGRIRGQWEKLGVRTVTADEVMRDAAVLIVDNSSIGPEFASLGRPVVWANAPCYRKGVEHHGRFWEWTKGQPEVDEPAGLVEAVAHALDDPRSVRAAREAMVRDVYAFTDGHASERAAAAVVELARGI